MKDAKLPEADFHTDGIFTVVLQRGINSKSGTKNVPSLSQACPKLEARYIVIAEQVIAFCSELHSIQEIMDIVGQTNRSRLK